MLDNVLCCVNSGADNEGEDALSSYCTGTPSKGNGDWILRRLPQRYIHMMCVHFDNSVRCIQYLCSVCVCVSAGLTEELEETITNAIRREPIYSS